MEVQFYKPVSEALHKYIEGFYFVTQKEIHQPEIYWTFPNNFCIAAVYQNTSLVLGHNKIVVASSREDTIASSLVSRYVHPIEIIQHDITEEITIYFKPLGLNHFVNNIRPFYTDAMIHFDPSPDYRPLMKEVFNASGRAEQIRQLESYWLSRLVQKELSLLESIIADIQSDLKINDIAQKNHISRQYLNKIFTQQVGKTPSEFRKIHRFRAAIAERQKARNFTELSHLVRFYDQSHFIRDFKNFTRLNPMDFFSKVDTEKENVWLEF